MLDTLGLCCKVNAVPHVTQATMHVTGCNRLERLSAEVSTTNLTHHNGCAMFDVLPSDQKQQAHLHVASRTQLMLAFVIIILCTMVSLSGLLTDHEMLQ